LVPPKQALEIRRRRPRGPQAWDAYQQAYSDAIAATGTPWAPWTIVPANSKTHRNLMIGMAVVDALKKLNLRYPAGSPELANLRVE
jgi:polyphosphate kinase 2 (PPK2 family)